MEISKLEKYFENKNGFWQVLFWEILCMFSNKPSFFSSKRFERFIMFDIAMWMIIGYTIRKWAELSVEDVLMLSGLLLGGSAWNATQIRKDQKDAAPNNTTPPTNG